MNLKEDSLRILTVMDNLSSSNFTVQREDLKFETLMTYEKNLTDGVAVFDEVPLICQLNETFEVLKTIPTRSDFSKK